MNTFKKVGLSFVAAAAVMSGAYAGTGSVAQKNNI
jgi:hypothetical protein